MITTRVEYNTELWAKTIDFAENCSWIAGKHLAGMMRENRFSDWESVFAAVDDGEVIGYCTLLKTDYYPENRYSPWISCVFVTEEKRGHRVSGAMIECAEKYAVQCGIKAVYIPTDMAGFYEKYGYMKIDTLTNYGGDVDNVYRKELKKMNYKVVNFEDYYRKGVYRHFTEDCKCSVSITNRIDVTELYECSKRTGTKFYLNFLYLLAKTMNSREDYRMNYLWETNELVLFDKVNPTQYIFHDDTETCTPVYSEYFEDYEEFYKAAETDVEAAKQTRKYHVDTPGHMNWFDASYISWLSYDSLNIELPDGHLFFMPIVNWGKFRNENGRLMMPVSIRMNHAIADGYLIAKAFVTLEKEIKEFAEARNG